jgi:methylthioribose-1-phosphate isomerase
MHNGFHTIAGDAAARCVSILDQTALPWQTVYRELRTLDEAAHAIRSMQVRGAPLIGVTAAFGVALALEAASDDAALNHALDALRATRPTAVNLHWALDRMRTCLRDCPPGNRAARAWVEAQSIAEEDAQTNAAIGAHGLPLLQAIAAARGAVRVMTHCNAGWLATAAHGTALAPIYAAHAAGIALHVWVSETRPRNQGLLTEWELRQAGVPHTFIADNSAGHLLMRGEVDIVIVGADRIAANGDVANKIGTYLKALAAHDNRIPFHVAAPLSTVDWGTSRGSDIPIEERSADEVRDVAGLGGNGHVGSLRLLPADVSTRNPAFDVTPARLIGSFITEHGCIAPEALGTLGPTV